MIDPYCPYCGDWLAETGATLEDFDGYCTPACREEDEAEQRDAAYLSNVPPDYND